MISACANVTLLNLPTERTSWRNYFSERGNSKQKSQRITFVMSCENEHAKEGTLFELRAKTGRESKKLKMSNSHYGRIVKRWGQHEKFHISTRHVNPIRTKIIFDNSIGHFL